MRVESAAPLHPSTSKLSNQPSERSGELPHGEVDTSKFQIAEQPALGSYATPGSPGEFTQIQTLEEGWQQYAHGSTTTLIAVPQAIPFGYEQVNTTLNSILAEHNLAAIAGTRISFGIAENDETGEVKFVVEDGDNPDNAKAIQTVLNSGDYEHFTDSYLALDQLTAGQNMQQAVLRDQVLRQVEGPADGGVKSGQPSTATSYKQEFALISDGSNWLMDVKLHPISLPPIGYAKLSAN